MIVSVQIAELGKREGLGVLARPPRPERVPGLRHAETVFTNEIGGGLLPRPDVGTVGLVAAWEDDAAFERFAAAPPARRFAGGWQVRLEPLRVSGAWPEVPDLLDEQRPVDDEEPVAVLTIGRTKPWRLPPFLHAAAAAEADALEAPGLLAATGFGRLPRLVSTFSLWRSAAEMREYAYRAAGAHQAAVTADRAHPFHFSSAFIRFRPYLSSGSWEGRNPLELPAVAR
jgi:hypothetical protein